MASSSAPPAPLTTYYSWFPGEDFLRVDLPNYDWERKLIVIKIVASIIIFMVILPNYFAEEVPVDPDNAAKAASDGTSSTASTASTFSTTQPVTNGNGHSSKSHPSKRRNGKKNTPKKPATTSNPPSPTPQTPQTPQTPPSKPQTIKELSLLTQTALNLSCFLILFAIIFLSTNNLFPARTLLRAPLFSREECQHLIQMAQSAADKNAQEGLKEKGLLMLEHPELLEFETAISSTFYKKESNATELYEAIANYNNLTNITSLTSPDLLSAQQKLLKVNTLLKTPAGWKKDRHTHYPTTDLNLVGDPFGKEDREWLGRRLDGRLAPVVERAFGIARGAIRANDIFVVRYDASHGQPNLRTHTDSSHLSFNVLLNDEFEGGGTRFHTRVEDAYIDVQPDVGETLLAHASIRHEGLATTKGTRYILVGFDSIDEKDPLTGESTNLSLFASWLNLSWAQVRFREGWEQGTQGRRKRNRLASVGTDPREGSGTWKENRYVTSLFNDLDDALTWFADYFAPFRSAKLVDNEKFDEYFRVMDAALEERQRKEFEAGLRPSRATGYSNWFAGQNLHLDVFGQFESAWASRERAEENFKAENL